MSTVPSFAEELELEQADIPFSEHKDRFEGIDGHVGSAIIIIEFQGERKVLLVQRVGGSKSRSWEVPGGKYEKGGDKTIVDTAMRETEEETGWKFTRDDALDIVYRSAFNISSGAKYDIHYIIVNQELDVFPDIKLRDDEHREYGFFTKEQVEGFATRTEEEFKNKEEIKQAINSGQRLMLPQKKELILKAFEVKSKELSFWGRFGHIGFGLACLALGGWVGYVTL